MTKEDAFYQAMLARDARFDGKFFVGVKTTGIYCRPICPAKPKRENVEFFPNPLAAERAGYRPCLRCRPESAPLSPAWIGKSAVVRRALSRLQASETFGLDEDEFAVPFGVSARHLRRLFKEEVGKTPKQLWFESRLNLSRKLLVETDLPVTRIAYTAGFRSIRRFNDAFKDRFNRNPSQIRRRKITEGEPLKVSLSYRPPFDFAGLLSFYRSHKIGDLEWFDEGRMHRIVEFGGKVGEIAISNDPEHSCLWVEIDFPLTSAIAPILARVRALFDLDSDPLMIANALELDRNLKKLLNKYPGVRLPSGWSGFEVAIGTILGQLVSVERGRALVCDLIELAGSDSGLKRKGKSIKLFPKPEQILKADLGPLKTTSSRKKTLLVLCEALLAKEISLEPTQDVDEFIAKVTSLHGIGAWTAQYMAMKVLRHTDAFPTTDLIIARALEIHPEEIFEQMRPWRAYATVLLWREYARKLVKRK